MTHRLGFLSASGLALVGIVYAIAVALGIAEAGFDDPIVDPVLAVMEIVTLIAAPLVVILMSAVYGYADRERKTIALASLSFAVLMAGMTSAVHFVSLTWGRQTGITTLQWPSTLYALELLAWDVFLGLSLVCAAPVFAGPGLNLAARWCVSITGALCLVGTLGPIIGDMALQRIGILGYGVALPITCFILARVFRRAGMDRVATSASEQPG